MDRRRWAPPLLAACLLAACLLAACTSARHTTADTVLELRSASTDTVAPRVVHPTRSTLAAALPATTDLPWLPARTAAAHDSDLTDRLTFVGCSAAPHSIAVNRGSATNVGFDANGDRAAVVTYYDVDSVDEAELFLSGTRAFLRCPNQGNPVSVSLLPLATPTACDDVLALRTRQPVGETIDAWCRVGNLIGWIRLYPVDAIAPTDSDGIATVNTVGTRLAALFA